MSDSYEPRAGQGHDGDDNHVSTRTAGERALADARRERDEARAEVERLKAELADRYQNPPTMAKYEHMVADVERLRALCAARPKIQAPWTIDSISAHNRACATWADQIDAAGRGEG